VSCRLVALADESDIIDMKSGHYHGREIAGKYRANIQPSTGVKFLPVYKVQSCAERGEIRIVAPVRDPAGEVFGFFQISWFQVFSKTHYFQMIVLSDT
jgi:hypothetical protein